MMSLRLLVVAPLTALLLSALPARSDARVELPSREHDFGVVRRGRTLSFAFRVRNTGDAPLAFRAVRFGARGLTARVPGTLAPGAEGSLAIEWATDRLSGNVETLAHLDTSDPNQGTVTLVLKATVEGALDVEPIPAAFLSAFKGEDARRELTLRSHQKDPVDLRLEPPSPGAPFTASLAPLEAGRAWRLTVRPATGADAGRHEGEVRLVSDDPSIGTVRIPVHLLVKDDVYANPSDLDFGDVSIAALAGAADLVEQLVLVKKREGGVHVRGVSSSVAALRPRASSEQGASPELRVGFAPALAPGSLEGSIAVETDDPRFPVLTIRTHGRLLP